MSESSSIEVLSKTDLVSFLICDSYPDELIISDTLSLTLCKL